VSRRLAGAAARERLVLAASAVLLVALGSAPVAIAFVLYVVAFHAAVERCPRPLGTVLVVALVAAMIVLPVWAIVPLGALGGHAREFTAFATNIAILRLWGYAWDRWHGVGPRASLRELLLAVFFFPTFVNGPIETPRQFAADWRATDGRPDAEALARGLARVALGAAKLVLIGLALPPGWTGVLANGADASAAVLWRWAVLLYVWFFLSFSAWSDVAIGLALLCGRRVQENFFAPWRAPEPADFWRRWHVSLGLWLRDYVYIPLGGNRRHRALNVLVVFGVSAAWHVWGSLKLLGFGYFPPRGWGGLALWGGLHTLGVLAAGPLRRAGVGRALWPTAAGRVATFLFASLCWVPFFLPGGVSLRECLAMLARMVFPF